MHRAAAIAFSSHAPWLASIALTLVSSLPAQTPTQFTVRTPATVALSPLTEAVAADFDGDGDLDIFASKSGAASRLWRNTGLLAFVDASANLPTSAISHTKVVAADFDGDGDVDLAAAGSSLVLAQNRMFVNNGAGVFTAIDPFPGNSSLAIAAADFDGDGDQDLAVATWFGLSLFRNDGNLVFTDVSATWLPAMGATPLEVAFGDLDGDGDRDLVVASQTTGANFVLRNTGSAFVVAGTLSPTGGTKSIALADYDEDGDVDIIRSINAGAAIMAVNDGTGTFTAAPSRLPVLTVNAATLVGGDFDRDGDRDLMICEQILGTTSLLVNRHRDLQAGPAILGQTWTIDVGSTPGYATLHHMSRLAIGLARLPQPLQVPGFGELWIDLGAGYLATDGIVLANTGNHAFSFLVPPLPQLIGFELHVQALIEQARAPARFTAYRSVVVQ